MFFTRRVTAAIVGCLKRLFCFIWHHDWATTWHGQDWYEFGWKNYEAINCLRCHHRGVRYEGRKKLPLFDNVRP
jgi:hypothetical protein